MNFARTVILSSYSFLDLHICSCSLDLRMNICIHPIAFPGSYIDQRMIEYLPYPKSEKCLVNKAWKIIASNESIYDALRASFRRRLEYINMIGDIFLDKVNKTALVALTEGSTCYNAKINFAKNIDKIEIVLWVEDLALSGEYSL